MQRKDYLDSLKGMATCGIIMIHTCSTEFGFPLGNIIAYGKYFVTLFFLISFYLMFESYGNYLKQNGSERKPVVKWWLNKYFKLMPIYYLVLIIGIFKGGIEYWYGSEGRVSGLNIISHFFFLHGFSPYYANSIIGGEWYLADLAIFILLTPLLYKVINSLEKSVVFIFFSIISSNLLIYQILTYIPENDGYIVSSYFGTFWFVAQLPVYAISIFIFFMLKKISRRILHKKIVAFSILMFSIYVIVGELWGGKYHSWN